MFSALGRDVVDGRFAAVVEGVMVDLRSDGAALPAPAMVLRTAGFLFSSAEVTAESSGSSDGAALEASVRLTAVAGARVGGLLKLEPEAASRDVELVRGFDALLGGRVVVLVDAAAAAGRRAAEAAVLLAAAGRRGGTASLLGALEAILRRRTDEGEDGGGSDCC